MADDARVTATPVEVVSSGDPDVRITQVSAEAVHVGDPHALITEVNAEVYNIGDPYASLSGITVEVWRSQRDAPYPVFPVRLFNPPKLAFSLRGGAVISPASVAGDVALEDAAVNARWSFDFGEVPLWTPEKVLEWRTFTVATDLGVGGCLVTLWDRLHAPVNPLFEGVTALGEHVWGPTTEEEIGFDQVDATFAVVADRGATVVSWNHAGPIEPESGDHFSVYGSRFNWRLYRIIRVLEIAGGVVTAEIRPGLREPAVVGKRLNFDYPCCVARIADDDLDATVEMLRFGKGSMQLVEYDSRYP